MTNYWRLERDIEIVQGKTWTAKFRYLTKSCKGKSNVPVDLSGFGASMVIRECAKDSASLLTLTAGDGITLGADGTIEIEMTATQASNLTAGDNVYEIELSQGYLVIAFATGKAKVYEEIARTPPPPLTFNAVIVSGAGSTGSNGTYTERGTLNGKPYYNLLGENSDDDINEATGIFWVGVGWTINFFGGGSYFSSDDTAFPWLAEYILGAGASPVPTLTPTNV
jgi:hypothetical protein